MATKTATKGGEFLFTPVGAAPTFMPESVIEEHRLFARTAREFVAGEVTPLAEELEHHKYEHNEPLLKKAGELGLLSIDIPEKYEGLEQKKAASMLLQEAIASNGSFSVTLGAHIGIGTMPILFFGNDEQKAEWLPKLASGEKLACYALTEPGSGSDALAARCKATLSEDGTHYLLNGTKQWITNAGFSDVAVVFAKIDGDKFTGFIVPLRDDAGNFLPGVAVSTPWDKMGIRGSGTYNLILEDAKVPVGNLLGEPGKGHRIAFNILNIGRLKLGHGAAGGSKYLVDLAVAYAKERKAFNKPLSDFPAIKEKLANMAIRVYLADSMNWRATGLVDEMIELVPQGDPARQDQEIAALEEFNIESSITKVYGTETLDYVSDEALQIHGGYGYMEEYEVCRAYRDSRINRIFEGTNEINRMIIPGTLLKRSLKGHLPLMQVLQTVAGDIADPSQLPQVGNGPLSLAIALSERIKRIALHTTGLAVNKFMMGMEEQQEVLMKVADLVIEAYAVDSTTNRVLQLVEKDGAEARAIDIKIANVAAFEAQARVNRLARGMLMDVFEGDELETHLGAIAQLYLDTRLNLRDPKRAIAEYVTEKGWAWKID